MNKLDEIQRIRKLDKSNMIGSIEELYLQCQQTWDDIQKIKAPPQYKKAKNIIVVGMGGSALGAHVVQTLYLDKLNIPIQVINDYHLPAYANEETLVVLSSNSGTTEEVLYAAEEAKAKKTLMMGMATGGKLAEFLKKNKIPSYIFEQKHNPSGQPRMGIGYMILGTLGLFHKLGLIDLEEEEIYTIIKNLKGLNKVWGIQSQQNNNIAKKYAKDCFGKIVIIVSSSFLTGNVHAFNNQLNENAKNFSAYFTLPEIDHHLMEGLGFPKTNPQNLIFIFINSPFFDTRIKKRFKLTETIVKRHKIHVLEFVPKGTSKLMQVFEVLLFGSYIGFYLAMLNNLDPSLIPWVDYFKEELAK